MQKTTPLRRFAQQTCFLTAQSIRCEARVDRSLPCGLLAAEAALAGWRLGAAHQHLGTLVAPDGDGGVARRLGEVLQEPVRPQKSIDLLIVENDPTQRFKLFILASLANHQEIRLDGVVCDHLHNIAGFQIGLACHAITFADADNPLECFQSLPVVIVSDTVGQPFGRRTLENLSNVFNEVACETSRIDHVKRCDARVQPSCEPGATLGGDVCID